MRWLFVLLIAVFIVSDVFGLGMSMATGLSVKNAVLYAIVFALFFRVVLGGLGRFHVPWLTVAFCILIGYAAVTWLAAALVIRYQGYHLFAGLITLKTRLIDPALMLFAAFYGLRDTKDAQSTLKVLLGAIVFANVMTLADAKGLVHIGLKIGESGAEFGRVFGAFGHANETGTLIVCLLPTMVALAFTTRHIERAFWTVGALTSAMVLLMTVSRGAFVGLFIGCVWAMYLCRRYVPLLRFVGFGVIAFIGTIVAVAAASIVDPMIGNTIMLRLTGDSSAIDVGEASSGRTGIWWEAVQRMMETPLSFITGFGWDVYSTMPFRYATHNTYLWFWFDLGIGAVLLFVFILARTLMATFAAINVATPEIRTLLISFVFGFMSLCVGMMFADLITPWPYIWMYVGIVLKIATLERARVEEHEAATRPPLMIRPQGVSAFGRAFAGRPH